MAAVEVGQALRIDEDLHPGVLVDLVARLGIADLHRVGHARASPALHEEAQALLLGGKVPFLEQVAQVGRGGVGEFDHPEK